MSFVIFGYFDDHRCHYHRIVVAKLAEGKYAATWSDTTGDTTEFSQPSHRPVIMRTENEEKKGMPFVSN